MPSTGTPGTPELVGTFTVRIPADTDAVARSTTC